ncbi:hypothetical protein OAE19_07345 [Porticoccaceae bacterium]|nr:hypothetical protein [Porticoccaceae bacterium]
MSLTMPDFLKKESIVPIKKLQDFTFLDRDGFLADNDVDALAKKEARDNLPAKSSKIMDANELTFIQQLTQASTAATMTLNSSLADIAKGIATIDVEAEKAELDNAVGKIEAELMKEYESQAEELDELKREAEVRQEDVDKFKKENRLKCEASYKDSYIMTAATILGALVIETALNSSLLAEASDFGLFGGASQAIIISVINISLGLVIGMGAWPKTNHIKRIQSTLGYIYIFLGSVAVLTFNLLIGHYREVLIENPDDSGIAAVKQFQEGMFNLTEIESIFLVVIGLLVAGLSFWKGMSQNDRYPGYTHVSKHRDIARERLYEAKNEALEELNAINEECEEGLRKLLNKVTVDYSRCTTLFSTFELQQKLYESYIADLAQTGEIAVSRYRQVNRSSRDDDAPNYFDQPIVINFKQKPIIPRFPDIKGKLNRVVENFGSRIPALKIEFSKAVEGYRKKIVAIEL